MDVYAMKCLLKTCFVSTVKTRKNERDANPYKPAQKCQKDTYF